MASLPPRPASQRRSSPRAESPVAVETSEIPIDAIPISSETSQTLLLNNDAIQPSQDIARNPTERSSTPRPSSPEVRKCWICFADESEDTIETSEWRDPCPCALVAHESCLLDWIADMEAPNTNRRAGRPAEVKCPQCKKEIKVVRPKSVVIEGVRALEKIKSYLFVPSIAVVFTYMIENACRMHGIGTVYLIFGPEDGGRILAPLYEPLSTTHSSVLVGGLLNITRNFRLRSWLETIPIVLIASQTKWSDSFLPVLPMIYLATSPHADEVLRPSWPPSASLSFAVLPYLRSFYNAYYERVWAPHEKRWLKAIQPRANEDEQDGEDGNAEGRGRDDEDEALFEINVEFAVEGDWNGAQENGQNPEQAAEQDREAGDEANNVHDGDAAEPPPDVQRNRPENEGEQEAQANQEAGGAIEHGRPRQDNEPLLQLIGNAPRAASLTLGGLVFPAFAAGSGELLALLLPRHWVTKPSGGARVTGLLQTRWGRSLVGGCLFVVLRDTVMLYVRWRMWKNHGRRRVADYTGDKGVNKAGRRTRGRESEATGLA